MLILRTVFWVSTFAAFFFPAIWAQAESENSGNPIRSIDHFVPHISSVPAINSKLVGLYVREKVQHSSRGTGPVVLMIHGHPVGSTATFDVAYNNYSWMNALAESGLDVFALDLTGYGLSPTPAMDDPCNASDTDQSTLLGRLTSPCPPRYAFQATTAESDWADIDAVVDYIRQLRRVDKVSLIGWSVGGPRAGGYAARYPDKVARLVMYSPVYNGGNRTHRRTACHNLAYPFRFGRSAPFLRIGTRRSDVRTNTNPRFEM